MIGEERLRLVEFIRPFKLNAQIREQMQTLRNGEMTALTKAAIRRIHVREERGEKLARRFMRKLKSNPVRQDTWKRVR